MYSGYAIFIPSTDIKQNQLFAAAPIMRPGESVKNCDNFPFKMIVEQNPQIPDRTGNSLGTGTDPTIALFATCNRLEAAEADLIAIPCNTAHAFVDRMQAHVRVPVLNMLDETMAQIAALYPGQRAGLPATSGTVASGVYAAAAGRPRISITVPDDAHQALVMEAIYGAAGVKAGFTTTQCRNDLLKARWCNGRSPGLGGGSGRPSE